MDKSPYPPLPPVKRCNVASYFLESPHQNKDDVAIVDAATKQSLTYAQLRKESLLFADGMSKRLRRGDTVLILSSNSVTYPVMLLASFAAGMVVSTANHTYTADEVAYQLDNCGAKLLLVHSDLVATAKKAAELVKLPTKLIYVLPDNQGQVGDARGLQSYLDLRGDNDRFKPVDIPDPEKTVACLPYSSGTTGRAKGVCLSHYNLVAMSTILSVHPIFNWKARLLCFLPMYHAYGLILLLLQAIRNGGLLVTMNKFDFDGMGRAVQDFKLDFLPCVPPILLALVKNPATDKYDWSSLKTLLVGAAPTSEELQRACEAKLNLSICQGLGMTETTGAAVLSVDGKYPGRIGWPLAGVDVRLVDEDGKDVVELGKPGELWLRGPNMMMGYHNNDKANRETFVQGGWMRTGDVCVRHEDGQLSVVDRIKELIKYKALQIAPAELEGLLVDSPLVADAGVIGVWSEEQATELPRAYIVPSPDHANDKDLAAKVAKYIEERVAPHKRLRGGVFILEAIPKSPSGKILRKDLRALASKEGVKNKL